MVKKIRTILTNENYLAVQFSTIISYSIHIILDVFPCSSVFPTPQTQPIPNGSTSLLSGYWLDPAKRNISWRLEKGRSWQPSSQLIMEFPLPNYVLQLMTTDPVKVPSLLISVTSFPPYFVGFWVMTVPVLL